MKIKFSVLVVRAIRKNIWNYFFVLTSLGKTCILSQRRMSNCRGTKPMIKKLTSEINRLDISISRRINELTGNPRVDRFMYFASRSGEGPAYAAVSLLMFAIAPGPGASIIMAGLTALALQLTVQNSIKYLVRRKRPSHVISGIRENITPHGIYSFPSGHAGGACMVAGIVSYFLPVLAVPFFGWAVLISLSRIYNGVHYASDVLLGMCLGFITGGAGIWVTVTLDFTRRFLTYCGI